MWKYSGAVVLMFLAVGCSSEQRPGKSDIQRQLAIQLPAFTHIANLEIDGMENIGSQVDPIWHARFHADVKTLSPTYTPAGSDAEVTFLRLAKHEGETTDVFGKSISKLYEGAWRTTIELEGQPLEAIGLPESSFGPGRVVVRGSKSETALVEERAARQRAALLTSQRANVERRKMLASAAQLLVGSWRDEISAMSFLADGTYSRNFNTGRVAKGAWAIDGDVLTTVEHEADGEPFEHLDRYKILLITQEIAQLQEGDTVYHATRTK